MSQHPSFNTTEERTRMKVLLAAILCGFAMANSGTISITAKGIDDNNDKIKYQYNGVDHYGLVDCNGGVATKSKVAYDAFASVCDTIMGEQYSTTDASMFKFGKQYDDTGLTEFCLAAGLLEDSTVHNALRAMIEHAGKAGDEVVYYRRNRRKIGALIRRYILDNANDPKNTKVLSVAVNSDADGEGHHYIVRVRGKNGFGASIISYYNVTVDRFMITDFESTDD